jgi:hypothetical protein
MAMLGVGCVNSLAENRVTVKNTGMFEYGIHNTIQYTASAEDYAI